MESFVAPPLLIPCKGYTWLYAKLIILVCVLVFHVKRGTMKLRKIAEKGRKLWELSLYHHLCISCMRSYSEFCENGGQVHFFLWQDKFDDSLVKTDHSYFTHVFVGFDMLSSYGY